LGDGGSIFLSSVLYFELFSCLSIFLVSLGDHLHALFPTVSQSRHMTTVAGLLVRLATNCSLVHILSNFFFPFSR
jgi:hypothetical protein